MHVHGHLFSSFLVIATDWHAFRDSLVLILQASLVSTTHIHIFVRSMVTKQHFVCFAARPRLAVHISSGNLGRVLTSVHRHTSLQCETSFSVATLPKAYRKMDVSCTALKDCPSSLTVLRYAPHIGADMSGGECFLSHVLYLGCVQWLQLHADFTRAHVDQTIVGPDRHWMQLKLAK